MTELLHGEDPEPADRFPAGPLYIPVRPGPSGCAARLFRTPLGRRTAVGFTSERRLAAPLGHGQAWIRLAEPALRALTAPLGVTIVTVDPQFTAPARPGFRTGCLTNGTPAARRPACRCTSICEPMIPPGACAPSGVQRHFYVPSSSAPPASGTSAPARRAAPASVSRAARCAASAVRPVRVRASQVRGRLPK